MPKNKEEEDSKSLGLMLREVVSSHSELQPLVGSLVVDGIEICESLPKKMLENNVVANKLVFWNEKYDLLGLLSSLEAWNKRANIAFLIPIIQAGKNVLGVLNTSLQPKQLPPAKDEEDSEDV